MSHFNEMLRRHVAGIALSLMAVVPLHAQAITLAVDFDPGTAGIQSTLEVMAGDDFVVDVVIADAMNVTAFVFDLDFDPGVLSASSVVSGNFLPTFFFPPGVPFPPQTPQPRPDNGITANEVRFGETAFGSLLAVGDGVLASITFTALSDGINTLGLNDVELLAPFAAPIPFADSDLFNGTVTVSSGGGPEPTPAPAPASGALLALGLLGL